MTAHRRLHPVIAAIGLLALLLSVLAVGSALGSSAHSSKAKVAGSVTIRNKTFTLNRPDQKQRLTVGCPGKQRPLGGGMTSSPPPSAGGEGVYPHSYERLGVQRGWHVTAVLFDPDHRSTQARNVTLQVACGPRLGHVTPPHKTKYVKPGQTKKVVARCPGRRHIFSGGFQRTDFISKGGNYVIESRAISNKAWRVVGHAFGGFGGELTAIAYCTRSKRPLISEVSNSTSLAPGFGSVTTPSCPPGTRMTAGGFSSNGSTSMFLTNGIINGNGTWSASGYNWGSGATLSAYGYCLRR
ncbi:MAG TPA: hypothetical protein VH501_09630 [Solirubrobacterales bacterium]|jgi:hypothetical protein